MVIVSRLEKRGIIMDKEFVFLAPLSALIGIIFDPILACAGIMMVLTLSALLYCSQAKEEKKALEAKLEELKAKLEHMALAKIQSETERVLLQYYAMERGGGLLRRRIKSSSDVSAASGLAG